jgi:hypothetical protein
MSVDYKGGSESTRITVSLLSLSGKPTTPLKGSVEACVISDLESGLKKTVEFFRKAFGKGIEK